jgi:hypothetical protein
MSTMAQTETTENGEEGISLELLHRAVIALERAALDGHVDETGHGLDRWAEAGITTARILADAALGEIKGARVIHDIALSTDDPMPASKATDTLARHVESQARREAFDLAERHAVLAMAVVDLADLVMALPDLTPEARTDAYAIVTQAMTDLAAAGLITDSPA